MTKIRAVHRFFPVGQGLFAAGSVHLSQILRSEWRHVGGRRIRARKRRAEVVENVYRWVYDCGSSSAKRLVINAISDLKSECKREKIDLLTLSHFHNDHISGVVELLKEIGAKTVMLPWAPLWHRLLIGFEQGLRADDPEMLFFVDPVQYFAQEAGDGFEQILFVIPSNGEGPPFPTEPTATPEPPEDLADPDKPSGPGEPVSSGDLEGEYDVSDPRVRMLRPGQAIPTLGVWEFLPYNDPATRPSDPTGFEAKVTPHRQTLLSGNDQERKSALTILRDLYLATFGPRAMNDISLVLYGGAIGQWCGHCKWTRRFYPFSNRVFGLRKQETRAAILLTGDGNLSSVSKWIALEKYLDRRRAVRTSFFQVSHHGARANWYHGLADAASPDLSVFSSDPNHSYGHPHAEVLRDFWKYRAIQVDQHSGFSIHFILER